jgi:signal transduction histidine kinase
VAISTNPGVGTGAIEGDGNRLAQVVDNIIQNALDAMPDGGQLTISCHRSRNQSGAESVRVNFEDTWPRYSAGRSRTYF